jgi:hypothetical protein
MAAEITFSILNPNMPNPLNFLSFADYRIFEINKNTNLFNSKDNLKPSDLLVSLIDLSEILIAYNDFECTLPILALAEHIACDIIKNTNILLKIRINKVICLGEIGLISEAIQSYIKIIKKVDLPNLYNINSFYLDKNNGRYFNLCKEIRYLNHLSPDNPKNVETVINFFKMGTGDLELKNTLQVNLHAELIYSRAIIIFKIFEKENYLHHLEIKPDTAFRLENLSRIEREMRDVILQLSLAEEINTITKFNKFVSNNPNLNNFNDTIRSGNSNPMRNTTESINNIQSKNLIRTESSAHLLTAQSGTGGIVISEIIQKRMEEICNSKRITNDEINSYYLTKNLFREEVDLRSERMDCILKSRILLSRIYQAQGLFLNASGIALKALENNKKFIEYQVCGIEKADDFICNLYYNFIHF